MTYGKAYYRGIKAGRFINNYLYKDETKITREERKQIRQDNADRVLYGSDFENKVRGDWK
jgi:hypothetical protein